MAGLAGNCQFLRYLRNKFANSDSPPLKGKRTVKAMNTSKSLKFFKNR